MYAPPTPRVIIRQAADHIGLYDPGHDSGSEPKSYKVGFLMVICAMLGLVVLGLAGLNLGITIALISSIVAFVPAIFYLAIFLWLDRYDPEPPLTLAVAFAWGATVSVLFSGIINDIFLITVGDSLTSIITAPVIEEAFKGLGVALIAVLFRKDFDSVVDGIVYAGVVALGFAAMENIDYYGRSMVEGGVEYLIGTFLIRGVLAPFSHVLFTSPIGIGCGIARETHDSTVKFGAPLLGCLAAMSLHSIWNTLATLGSKAFFAGYMLFEVPLFVGFIFLVAGLVRREGRILRQTLAAEVERGLITLDQLEIAISVFRRTEWIMSALGDSRLFNARRKFLRTVAKLGLCHWHRYRAHEAQRVTGSLLLISQLQAELFSLRDQI
jgi:RsiW-degrading membrane proteinase PrsW (M82 family)